MSETPALAARLGEILAQLGVSCAAQSITEFEQAGSRAPGREPPDVAFVAVNRIFPPHLELLRRLRGMVAGKIVVLATIPNHTAVLHAVRAGADDFIDLSGDIFSEIHSLIGRLSDEPAAGGPRKRMITILASADPSDANLVAANGAVSIAQRFGKCELVDLHLRGGDLAAMFGLSPRHTVADLLRQSGEIDRAMFEQALAVHSSGVRLLAAPKLFNELGAVDALAVQRVLSLARAVGFAVIVHAADAQQCEELRLLAASDRVVLTTRLDLVSLMRAKHHLAFLVERGVAPSAIRVVAMCTGRRGEVPPREMQRALGDFDVECVPDDLFAQMVSVNVGEPMVLRVPKSEASRAICRIAASFFEDGTSDPLPRATRTSLFSLPRWRSTPGNKLNVPQTFSNIASQSKR